MSAAPIQRRRALLYDRVSTKVQSLVGYSSGADGFQLERCEAYATANDIQVIGTITDVDSGAKWEIAGIMEALERAKRHEYELLIVSDTSRFARSMAKKLVYEAELRQHGVHVVYTNLPGMLAAPTTAEERLIVNTMSGVFGAYDEYDREKRAWWTSNGRLKKAQQGKVVGAGPAPYGYRYVYEWVESRKREVPIGLELDPDTHAIVERIFQEIRTHSTYQLALALTSDGVAPPASYQPSEGRPRTGKWHASTIRRIVRDPVYIGRWAFADVPVSVPPLVSTATFEIANVSLDERKQRARRPRREVTADPYLLRGALTCGACGGSLQTRDGPAPSWRNGHLRRYWCGKSLPSVAKRHGWEPCPLGGLLAADERVGSGRQWKTDLLGIEDVAWQELTALYALPGVFEARLDDLQARTGETRDRHANRLAIMDAEIAAQLRLMERAEAEKLKLEPGDRRYAYHVKAGLEASRAADRLEAARAAYAAKVEDGLTADQERAARADAEMVRQQMRTAVTGGAVAIPVAERGAIFARLRLRGTVWPASAGEDGAVRLGAGRWVRVEWTIGVNSGSGFLKLSLLFTTTGPALALVG